MVTQRALEKSYTCTGSWRTGRRKEEVGRTVGKVEQHKLQGKEEMTKASLGEQSGWTCGFLEGQEEEAGERDSLGRKRLVSAR